MPSTLQCQEDSSNLPWKLKNSFFTLAKLTFHRIIKSEYIYSMTLIAACSVGLMNRLSILAGGTQCSSYNFVHVKFQEYIVFSLRNNQDVTLEQWLSQESGIDEE